MRLFRALDRFDFASGGNFTAYAAATIRYAILDALPMEDTIRVSYDLSWRNRTDERIEALRAFQPLSLDALHGEEDCAVVVSIWFMIFSLLNYHPVKRSIRPWSEQRGIALCRCASVRRLPPRG